MHECMNAWMHANNHLDIHLTQTIILPTQKKCTMFKRNLSNLPQTICMKCNIPPKQRVRILMTSKWLRSDPNPFTHPHLWPKSFKEVGACPQRFTNNDHMGEFFPRDTKFSKPTGPQEKWWLIFLADQQIGQKEFKKKTSLGWNTSTLFWGGF